jgi:betaine lipid synthase
MALASASEFFRYSITFQHVHIILTACSILLLLSFVFICAFSQFTVLKDAVNSFTTFGRFFYASFLKPHTGDGQGGQQGALESFYKAQVLEASSARLVTKSCLQADVYDTTRKRLLRGREDLLSMVAAQLKYNFTNGEYGRTTPTWVDIGGGTGWNIEAMQEFMDVPTFFSSIYLVDLSPSLLEIARKRFARLGWKHVHLICQDARTFSLKGHQADVITMSYSLSMIPDYYSVVDSVTSLLDQNGIIGVIDFYVQSGVETSGRNYTGGNLQRHVNWLGRSFWRAWFDLDRVGLEGAKRVS